MQPLKFRIIRSFTDLSTNCSVLWLAFFYPDFCELVNTYSCSLKKQHRIHGSQSISASICNDFCRGEVALFVGFEEKCWLGFTSFAAIVCVVAQGHRSVWQHKTNKKMGITVSIIVININLLIQSQFNIRFVKRHCTRQLFSNLNFYSVMYLKKNILKPFRNSQEFGLILINQKSEQLPQG